MDTQTQIAIDASVDTVFRVVWDVECYPDFVSDVVHTEVTPGTSPQEQTAEFHVKMLRVRHYLLHMVAAPPGQIRWTLARGDSLRRNDGHWRITPDATGQGCVVQYQVGLDFAMAVPDAIVRKMVEFQLPVMLRQFKARAEQVHRALPR